MGRFAHYLLVTDLGTHPKNHAPLTVLFVAEFIKVPNAFNDERCSEVGQERSPKSCLRNFQHCLILEANLLLYESHVLFDVGFCCSEERLSRGGESVAQVLYFLLNGYAFNVLHVFETYRSFKDL